MVAVVPSVVEGPSEVARLNTQRRQDRLGLEELYIGRAVDVLGHGADDCIVENTPFWMRQKGMGRACCDHGTYSHGHREHTAIDLVLSAADPRHEGRPVKVRSSF